MSKSKDSKHGGDDFNSVLVRKSIEMKHHLTFPADSNSFYYFNRELVTNPKKPFGLEYESLLPPESSKAIDEHFKKSNIYTLRKREEGF